MTDLIERIRSAESGSRELDAAIAIGVGEYVLEKRGSDRQEWFYPLDGRGWRRKLNELPAYTTSLDAIVALIEKQLRPDHPGMTMNVQSVWHTAEETGRHTAEITWPSYEARSFAPTAPLALTLAFLLALEAQKP